MVWVPTDRSDVVNVAWDEPIIPADRVAQPSSTPPSEKVTLPVGEPGPVDTTLAVKVTAWPYVDGLLLVDGMVEVGPGWPWPTDWVRTAEVLTTLPLSSR